MEVQRNYEAMILLTEDFNDSELKAWVFNYVKDLRKFDACDISVISRGKQVLSYAINHEIKMNYIQLNFSSMPKYINDLSDILGSDDHVLRCALFEKKTNG
nr:ribosomal protein S6 [Pseudo-nitzschia hainanensis]